MYLFYIDESGNTGQDLDSAEQPVHWLVAIGVSPKSLRAVEMEMLALALKYFRERSRHPDFEFHGQHIYSRRGECRGWSAEAVVSLYRELLEVVARHDCALFICGIDKAAYKARARHPGYTRVHPHRLGFMYLVERIDQWLEEAQPAESLFETADDPVYGLLVADEQKEVDRQIIERFAFWRSSGTDYGSKRAIRYLIDTVHYVPSQDSWLIQLADCLAYIFSRYRKVWREKGGDAAKYSPAESTVVQLWEEHCEAKVVAFHLWP